ncbi:MAG: PEP-CTERM sorting domain-containing protein [Verrucomicrobiae bacterium]|nr:PEP-CTERM sorting domain-containing protein [Verrucomicrobiae bacterium]
MNAPASHYPRPAESPSYRVSAVPRRTWSSAALAAGLLLPIALCAQVILESQSYTPGLAVPDGSLVGISHTIQFPATIADITGVSVELEITGGFTGDFYAYLQHDTGFAVLLNRPGRTSNTGLASLGYLDSGFQVSFADDAANGDIHFYQSVSDPAGGALTGLWQPDARATSPLSVVGTEPRDALLASFVGLASGGAWTLFVADLSPGGVGTLDAWSLHVTGVAVPEPRTLVSLAGMALLAMAVLRRRTGTRREPVG